MRATYYFTIPSDIEDCCVAEYLRNLIQNKIKLNLYTEKEEALLVAKARNPRMLIMMVDDDDESHLFNGVQIYSEDSEEHHNFLCFGSIDYFKDDCEVWE